jgi:hypothetical protein
MAKNAPETLNTPTTTSLTKIILASPIGMSLTLQISKNSDMSSASPLSSIGSLIAIDRRSPFTTKGVGKKKQLAYQELQYDSQLRK